VLGIEIVRDPVCDQLEPHQWGQIYVKQEGPDAWLVDFRVRPSTTDEQIVKLRQWASTAVLQLEASGDPAANGWFPSDASAGWWHMTVAEYYLPPL